MAPTGHAVNPVSQRPAYHIDHETSSARHLLRRGRTVLRARLRSENRAEMHPSSALADASVKPASSIGSTASSSERPKERPVPSRIRTSLLRRPTSAKTRPSHHRPHGGFQNPWQSALKEGSLRSRGGSGSRTFFHKVARDRPPPAELLASLLLLATKPDFSAADQTLTRDKHALVSFWLGHTCFLMKTRSLVVLTDPVWSSRLGPLGPSRLVPPPCDISDLPKRIDVVLLTSANYDHFDKNAVHKLADRVGRWLVPLGLKALLVPNGVDPNAITELDWWQEARVGSSTVVCTPAQHFSTRDDSLWCSWVVHTPHHRFFFCGGTGYRALNRNIDDLPSYKHRATYGGPCCPVFKQIAEKYGPCDTAFLPIGNFKTRALMASVQGDPVDMLFVHEDLKARRTVAHRWGTFSSTHEGLLDAVRALEAAIVTGPVKEHEFMYVRHGWMHTT